jgi:hypothetical protein
MAAKKKTGTDAMTIGKTESGCSCQANNTNVPQETCIALPENTKSILFGLDDQGPGCGST